MQCRARNRSWGRTVPTGGEWGRGDLWGESSSSGYFPPTLIHREAKKNCDMKNSEKRGFMSREAPSSDEMVVWLDAMGLDLIRGISAPRRVEQEWTAQGGNQLPLIQAEQKSSRAQSAQPREQSRAVSLELYG